MGKKVLLLVFVGIVIVSGLSFSFFTADALNNVQVNEIVDNQTIEDTLSSNMFYTRTISDSVLVDDKM